MSNQEEQEQEIIEIPVMRSRTLATQVSPTQHTQALSLDQMPTENLAQAQVEPQKVPNSQQVWEPYNAVPAPGSGVGSVPASTQEVEPPWLQGLAPEPGEEQSAHPANKPRPISQVSQQSQAAQAPASSVQRKLPKPAHPVEPNQVVKPSQSAFTLAQAPAQPKNPTLQSASSTAQQVQPKTLISAAAPAPATPPPTAKKIAIPEAGEWEIKVEWQDNATPAQKAAKLSFEVLLRGNGSCSITNQMNDEKGGAIEGKSRYDTDDTLHIEYSTKKHSYELTLGAGASNKGSLYCDRKKWPCILRWTKVK